MKCGAHGVDLLLKDFGKFEYFQSTNERVNKVTKFVKNHHATAAIFSTKTKLQLISPNATGFGTHVIAGMRMYKV